MGMKKEKDAPYYGKSVVKGLIPLQPRQHYKYETTFDDTCACIMRHNPKVNRITLLHYGDFPIAGKRIVRKGRWYYFKWGKRLIYIKVIRVRMPEGFYETPITRISPIEVRPLDPELVKKLTKTIVDENYVGDAKIEWKTFKWEDNKQ